MEKNLRFKLNLKWSYIITVKSTFLKFYLKIHLHIALVLNLLKTVAIFNSMLRCSWNAPLMGISSHIKSSMGDDKSMVWSVIFHIQKKSPIETKQQRNIPDCKPPILEKQHNQIFFSHKNKEATNLLFL